MAVDTVLSSDVLVATAWTLRVVEDRCSFVKRLFSLSDLEGLGRSEDLLLRTLKLLLPLLDESLSFRLKDSLLVSRARVHVCMAIHRNHRTRLV